MKIIGFVSTAVLSLVLAAPVYAQEQQHDQEEEKAKPEQNEKKAQPEKSTKPEEKGAQPEKNAKPEEKNARQENNAKPEEKNARQENNAKPEEKISPRETNSKEEKNAQEQHAQPAQRAGGNQGGRIPDDRYKANFGQQHTFRVTQGDYNNHRFQYGGYSFGFVGAWPSNWLYTQNVYVIDIDGVYYLCNPMYPGVNIALDVTL
jgi:outer membrane biosynthesis protein TonB